MLHDTTRRPRTLLDWTQGLPVLTKVPHQCSRLLQPCRYTPHSSLTVLLLLSKKVSPRSRLGSIELPETGPQYLNQAEKAIENTSDLSPKVHLTLKYPQQSRQFCDTVGELTWGFAFVFAIVRFRNSRHRLFILSKGKVKKHRKDLWDVFLEYFGRQFSG